jgi:hypothetical protein
MKRRWRLGLGLALLLTAGISLILPAVRWPLIGWVRGEAFYQGRPTSYWEKEIQHYEMHDCYISGDLYFFPREPTAAEQWLKKNLGIYFGSDQDGPRPVIVFDSAAIPMLVELLDREDLKVRLFAIQSLGLIGPQASAVWATLMEMSRTTQEYLVYREALIALQYIDPKRPREGELRRPDEGRLIQAYRRGWDKGDYR